MPTIAIVGTTSWGITLGIALHRVATIRILARHNEEARQLAETRHSARLVEDVAIPEAIVFTADPEAALDDADAVVLAVPSQTMRANVCRLAPVLRNARLIISAAKGLEADSQKRMSTVIDEELGGGNGWRIAALSGPNLAPEIARGLPATSVIASQAPETARIARQLFMTPRLRVYSNTDLLGVEMCGALKNIIAIGAGIGDGGGFGQNAKAAFVTRGLAEMARLGTAVGANPFTFAGLAGLGDLWATCNSPYSRNRQLGERLGRGESIVSILASVHHVVEGVPTTRGARDLADRLGLETPIISTAYRVLFEGLGVEAALAELMLRDAKHELDGLVLG